MDLAAYRLYRQRLVGTPFETVTDAVRWLGAVQAQDYPGAKWALGLRVAGLTDADLDAAFDAGALLRTHVMRPTWHFVLPEDIRWLLRLTAPRVRALMAHYDRRLELDAPLIARSHTLLTDALTGGRSLTRAEITTLLEAHGIAARGQRLYHLLMHAELDALVCSGPRRGRGFTYALLDERAAPAPEHSRDEALALLARRYFQSHGPATAQDFAWWSGLKVADAKAGMETLGAELESARIADKTYWMTTPAVPVAVETPVVHLLPNFDEQIVAYRDHGPSVHPALRDTLARDVLIMPSHSLAVDGRIVGGWKRRQEKDRVVVQTKPMVPLGAAEHRSLEAAAAAYGRFLGQPVAVEAA